MKQNVGAGIGILMLKEGKILLGKRHDEKDKADSALRGEGTWTMPGGKLEWGETFEEGAKREVLEETGIVLNKVEVLCISNDMNEHAHFVTIGLICEDFEGEAQVLEPEEITQWKWFTIDDLPQPMFFPSIRVLECYKKKVFYNPN